LEYQGVLVKELAARTGISRNTLENYLSVRGHTPAADAAVKIARALGVSVEYLVTGEDPSIVRCALSDESRSLIKTLESLDSADRRLIHGIVKTVRDQRRGSPPG